MRKISMSSAEKDLAMVLSRAESACILRSGEGPRSTGAVSSMWIELTIGVVDHWAASRGRAPHRRAGAECS